LDHDAGLIWLGPVLPMTGRAARDVMQLVTPIFERHRFDPCVTLSLVTERAMVAVMNISFDRSDPEEAKRARDCYKQLLQRLFAAGYPPYRLGSTSYEQIPAEDDIFWNLVARLKVAIDPQHIFARGRYLPSSAYNGVGTASVGRSKPTLAN
jgi:4-cresol dehydrogenase (hydroxylating)